LAHLQRRLAPTCRNRILLFLSLFSFLSLLNAHPHIHKGKDLLYSSYSTPDAIGKSVTFTSPQDSEGNYGLLDVINSRFPKTFRPIAQLPPSDPFVVRILNDVNTKCACSSSLLVRMFLFPPPPVCICALRLC
jgi:hypothetical protein